MRAFRRQKLKDATLMNECIGFYIHVNIATITEAQYTVSQKTTLIRLAITLTYVSLFYNFWQKCC